MNEINKKLTKLITENPDIEIKIKIDGEAYDPWDNWYIGKIIDCCIGPYIEYEDRVFDDEDSCVEEIQNIIENRDYYEPNPFQSAVDEYDTLPKKQVLWVRVGV